MEAYRIGAKFFLADPASVQLPEFIPVFHGWIQKQAMPEHLLIDVHDYSHIHWGPGILLVGHEGNFSIDLDRGMPGLLYYRKREVDGSPEQRLTGIVRAALQACRMLEEEPDLGGKVRFRTDEIVITSNDRLLAPNNAETLEAWRPIVTNVLRRFNQNARFNLTHVASDTKERFSVRVETGQSDGAGNLLQKLIK
jgi:hypothetical protein